VSCLLSDVFLFEEKLEVQACAVMYEVDAARCIQARLNRWAERLFFAAVEIAQCKTLKSSATSSELVLSAQGTGGMIESRRASLAHHEIPQRRSDESTRT